MSIAATEHYSKLKRDDLVKNSPNQLNINLICSLKAHLHVRFRIKLVRNRDWGLFLFKGTSLMGRTVDKPYKLRAQLHVRLQEFYKRTTLMLSQEV